MRECQGAPSARLARGDRACVLPADDSGLGGGGGEPGSVDSSHLCGDESTGFLPLAVLSAGARE